MTAAARDDLNELIARVGQGDRAALRRVYDATSARLFGICLRLAGSRDAAEDALQETFLRVWRRADRFDPARASAMTWLALIARGVAIDGRRVDGRLAQGIAAAAALPEADTAATEIEELYALNECLARLDDAQGQFIRSAFYDGYSYDELARAAELPAGTMKSRIRRGLAALRKCLDGD
ncbi:RNA polymerase sigma-70 factor, ECF subfamily [Sphingomonas guangdongensis]|uniref:RNA polymerase sigma-70 factor, ECF subfamily n=1 Tax=Sphingomonas guangdongensis TaxID=1141890 RepID=A0A285QAQ3_9SPHN|nr:sigma-70 family RNA polymerase sigma factor [Sphingomonas guangdongensis]SOB78588.1 RNA polymerase sigma-70 factor, ECF subfamily [Sphingomonas guangdongensis]